jgi:hypothetical protein
MHVRTKSQRHFGESETSPRAARVNGTVFGATASLTGRRIT